MPEYRFNKSNATSKSPRPKQTPPPPTPCRINPKALTRGGADELDLDPDSDEADDFAECLSRYDDDNDYGDS